MSDYEVRTYADLDGPDRSGLPDQIARQRGRVAERLGPVDRVVAVASGKGGVGKSFVAVGLAAALARAGRRTGVLDADLSGPTTARMAGVRGSRLSVTEEGVVPPTGPFGMPVVSTDLLLEEDDPLRWRGPESESFVWRGAQEVGVLREFLSDVVWGSLDALVVDLPPGSDRFRQLSELVPHRLHVLAVTLSSGASRSSVARSLRLADEAGVGVVGLVENMAGYVCAGCGETGPLFPGRAGEELAADLDVPLLGRVPFDPRAAALADEGTVRELLEGTEAGAALGRVATSVADRLWREGRG